MTSRARRNSGMPSQQAPVGTGEASKMVTAKPQMARSLAQPSPAGPAPTTAIFSLRQALAVMGFQFSFQSAAARLSEQMAIHSSTSQARQAVWQGCEQTR